jgi:ribonuclease P protein component
VRRLGKSFAHPLIVLVVLPNDLQQSRFAVSAGRTIGNAVHRNRAKRLIRSALQPLVPAIDNGWDLLIIARKPVISASYSDVHQALIYLLGRADLIREYKEDGI